MDNIKTKLQTQAIRPSCEKLEKFEKFENCDAEKSIKNKNIFNETEIKYKNIASTVKKIYMESGILKGFFKGLTPRVLSNSPACAISWGTYEIVKYSLIKNIVPNNNNKNKN